MRSIGYDDDGEDEERKKEEEAVLLNDEDEQEGGENDDGLAFLRKLKDERRRFRYENSSSTTTTGGSSSTIMENWNCGYDGGIEESKALYIALEECKKSPEFMRMVEIRMKLPAWSYKDEILMLLKKNQVVVLSGDTGCGKSTQVPQFILEESINALKGAACNILCTEPRKISAVGLAERVAVERCEKGGAGSEMGLVGYQVRLQKRATRCTRLLYCTVGILLRRLVFDQNLEGISHIIVDEAHERQADMDFLLVLLRELCSRRSDIKIIIMSATIKEKDFCNYFGGVPCLTISEGKRFPVEIFYLEEVCNVLKRGKKNMMMMMSKGGQERVGISQAEWAPPRSSSSGDEEAVAGIPPPSEPVDQELLLDLIKYIVLYSDEGRRRRSTGDGGGILCFLSGFSDIDKLLRSIKADRSLDDICHSLGMHSSLSIEDQRSAFRPPPPPKTWKIVASTNVAEASITIPDITHVIDSGRVKELGHNPTTGLYSLVEVWGSQASAMQRSGRAGRVGPGTCWRLYPRLMEKRMLPYNIPEMLRVPLEDLLLQGIVLNAEPPESDVVAASAGGSSIGEGIISSNDPREILSKAMDPPTQIALDMALHNLVQLQACRIANQNNTVDHHVRPVSSAAAPASAGDRVTVHLTPLGFYLSQLPVPCRIGKLLIMGVLFECLDPILTVAAEMSSKTPFLKPFGALSAASKAHSTFEREADARSDHLAIVYAYEAWIGYGNDWARRNWCRQNYVGMEAMNTIRGLRSQFTHHLIAAGFINMDDDDLPSINSSSSEGGSHRVSAAALPTPKHSARKGDKSLLRCVLCSGLMPRMASFVRGKSPHFITAHDSCVAVHPGSVNHGLFQKAAVTGKSIFVVYHSKVRTSRTYMHDTTLVTPFSLLLWGGGSGGGARHLRRGDIDSEKRSSTMKKGNIVIELDSWLRFQADEEVAVIFKHLRTILNTALLERMLPKSGDEVGSKGRGRDGGQIPLSVPDCVTRLLRIEEQG